MAPTFCAADAVPRIALTSAAVSAISTRSACQSWYPGPGSVAPRCSTLPNTASRNRHASVAPKQLGDDVAGHAPPGKVAPDGERQRDARVQMRPRHGAHEQDDREHHQPGCDDRGRGADLPLGMQQAAAGGDEHDHEGVQQLGEQPAILEAGILELLARPEFDRSAGAVPAACLAA